jgi:hypothetical protein
MSKIKTAFDEFSRTFWLKENLTIKVRIIPKHSREILINRVCFNMMRRIYQYEFAKYNSGKQIGLVSNS